MTPDKFVSVGKGRLQRSSQPGRALRGYRRLGIEQLEDRRVLSGFSTFTAPGPIAYGPILPHMASSPTSSHQVAALSPAQLAAETTVGQSIDAFAEALYGQLQGQAGGSGNLFLSPLSISTALAMTYAGARGETATQMAAALHYTLDANTLAGDFASLLADLNSAGQNNYSLSVADALWGQQGYSFLAPFLNLVQADYDGGLHQVDFINDAEAARQTINNWVAQETNNKIQNLIPEGAIDQLTRLVLTNAIYFKGQWATAFDRQSHAECGLHARLGVSGAGSHHARHGLVPLYAERRLSGPGVALSGQSAGHGRAPAHCRQRALGPGRRPAPGRPQRLAARTLTPQQVEVSLPKFQMTTSFDLSQPLEALGMTDAFNPHAPTSRASAPTRCISVLSSTRRSSTSTKREPRLRPPRR